MLASQRTTYGHDEYNQDSAPWHPDLVNNCLFQKDRKLEILPSSIHLALVHRQLHLELPHYRPVVRCFD